MAVGSWFVCDCCGIACMCFTYLMLCSANSVLYRLARWPFGASGAAACTAAYEVFFVLGVLSHLSCMMLDPGTIPLDSEVDDPAIKQCQKCKCPKPPRAHHCSICERCIMKMDHHCPWVNNCVGARNQKHFVLFLLYVQLQCWAALVGLAGRIMGDGPSPKPRKFLGSREELRAQMKEEALLRAARRANNDFEILQCVVIFFVAILFGMFTCVMLCDQLSNVLTNQTGIEGLQGYKGKPKPWREAMQEVLGRGPSLWWLVPTLPSRAAMVKELDEIA